MKYAILFSLLVTCSISIFAGEAPKAPAKTSAASQAEENALLRSQLAAARKALDKANVQIPDETKDQKELIEEVKRARDLAKIAGGVGATGLATGVVASGLAGTAYNEFRKMPCVIQ